METTDFDLSRKYVRIIGRRDNGLVEFEFAIGDPALAVELIMPEAAFGEFCAGNQVEMLEGSAMDEAQGDWAWNLRAATHQRFRT